MQLLDPQKCDDFDVILDPDMIDPLSFDNISDHDLALARIGKYLNATPNFAKRLKEGGVKNLKNYERRHLVRIPREDF